ncbi:cyclophilin peptidyl-prolyl cis-trans isomerase Cyp8 [Cladophialophora chaetospira]|uniref:Peptidyl-prolyl cis-trans isomerase-like 2 n=1 Tax=Cladophialophora chaetospira TaxID=386627 RepID=A0AA38X038_9EURO|nr:cyclophilin peptidyl-prolyl cis-trans isomerase Cyp8 [Cladophialophora chaetospira]
MGKGTDKLYITHSEWASSDAYSASAGSGVRADTSGHASFKRLPFNFCALSLQPFTTPVCTAEGIIFDHENILRWLLKHDTNPATGKPLKQHELIKLNFAKNDADEYVDPVTFKVFTDNTHIVAVHHGDSANAFAYDTIERLNIKPKMWRDLVSDEEFTRKDIITLQDPQNIESRNLSSFKYLKDGEDSGIPKEEASINAASLGRAADLKVMKAKEAVAKARAERANALTQKDKASSQQSSLVSKNSASALQGGKPVPYNATRHTTGLAAASFTSTGMTVHTSNALATMTDEEYILKPKRVKIKGYARLQTTLGSLTLELYPEYAPKAVWNFVSLIKKGYYDGTVFHRNIRNFMLQGGDPTGTGRGGQSVWGKNFNDELQGPFKHDKRGVLSMANKGKNTNSSQFFITYRPTSHLDGKHTIFGRVVDDTNDESMDVLKQLENVPVDSNDRPKEDIQILEASVLLDPFEEFWKQKTEVERSEKEREDEVNQDRTTWTGKRIRNDGTVDTGDAAGQVGKYLKASSTSQLNAPEEDEVVEFIDDEPEQPARKKTKGGGGFGNFDSW